MNKKKIVGAGAAVALCVAIAAGGTLAYFTDTDAKDNVFTSGNVDVTLDETFTQESKLIPCTGSAQKGTLQNGVEKVVNVKNTGSEPAYVRVHIAIPSLLDDGDSTFDASKNVLHFNFTDPSYADGKWSWAPTADKAANGVDGWNYYTAKVDGIDYNVYVVTYRTALEPGQTTDVSAMYQVYLDHRVTSKDMERLNQALGEKWQMKVVAEAVQAAGFDNAFSALNEAFGTPGNDYKTAWASAVKAGQPEEAPETV